MVGGCRSGTEPTSPSELGAEGDSSADAPSGEAPSSSVALSRPNSAASDGTASSASVSPVETVQHILDQCAAGLDGYRVYDDAEIAESYRNGQFDALLQVVGSSGFQLDAPDRNPPQIVCSGALGEPVDVCARALHSAMRGLRRTLDLPPGPYVQPPRFEEQAGVIRVTFDQQHSILEFSKDPIALTRLYVGPGRTGHN